MPHDNQERSLNALVDMLISSRWAIEYLNDIPLEDFLESIQLQDSVIRRVEIIGEAAKRVKELHRPALDGITWQQICGMRDILIHQYNGVDIELIYTTVKEHLPDLAIRIKSVLQEHNHDPDQLTDHPSANKNTP